MRKSNIGNDLIGNKVTKKGGLALYLESTQLLMLMQIAWVILDIMLKSVNMFSFS